MLAVVAHGGQALGEHPARVVVHGLVEPVPGGQRAVLGVTGDEPPRPGLPGAGDHGGHGDRLARGDRGGHLTELRVALLADRLDEDVDDAAAGEADRQRGVVADAVALQHRLPGLEHLLGELIHRALDASAGHAADDFPACRHGQRGTWLPWCAVERPHHRGQAERLPGVPPLLDLAKDVAHGPSPPRNFACSS